MLTSLAGINVTVTFLLVQISDDVSKCEVGVYRV